MALPTRLRPVVRFAGVGGLASATHFGVYLALTGGWLGAAATPSPAWANALGFAVAFGVSFIGHRWLSFPDTVQRPLTSLARFVATSLAGLVTNEATFLWLIHSLSAPDRPALIAAMGVAAAQTYVLSRYWAFRR